LSVSKYKKVSFTSYSSFDFCLVKQIANEPEQNTNCTDRMALGCSQTQNDQQKLTSNSKIDQNA